MNEDGLNMSELTLDQQVQMNGGNIFVFIAGAIIGGIIYDAYKAACIAAVDAQVNHPEYYDGAVHSVR